MDLKIPSSLRALCSGGGSSSLVRIKTEIGEPVSRSTPIIKQEVEPLAVEAADEADAADDDCVFIGAGELSEEDRAQMRKRWIMAQARLANAGRPASKSEPRAKCNTKTTPHAAKHGGAGAKGAGGMVKSSQSTRDGDQSTSTEKANGGAGNLMCGRVPDGRSPKRTTSASKKQKS